MSSAPITFTKIENDGIFTRDFNPLVKNNVIDFPKNNGNIAVIYGPNGAGKTSLIKVLAGVKGTKLEFEYDGTTYSSGESVFHIINDQNSRNIIAGETKEFFLGDNIKREFELQSSINRERDKILIEIITMLKSKYGINAANSSLIDLLDEPKTIAMVKDISNNKSKGSNYTADKLITTISAIKLTELPQYDEIKLQFLKTDILNANSIIKQIEKLDEQELIKNSHIPEIEENTEAIAILERFKNNQCIVCDTYGIDCESLLKSKSENLSLVYASMDEKVKALVERIIKLVPSNDPFRIKDLLFVAVKSGITTAISTLISDFAKYKKIYSQLLQNDLFNSISKNELPSMLKEYQKIVAEKPIIEDEDMIYIQEIIENSMNKQLVLERDEKKNLKIKLQGQEFLDKKRDELELSTGEQNFLSLTFEFMKAKNTVYPVVVIDDPISSFDSIYKNKVVYAIVKILQMKKRIILTHNIDLLRLLENQYKNCYKLYLLNNIEGEENGFIQLKNKEQDMLINLESLIFTFRKNIFQHIKDVNLFMISMIPFMRGYSKITNKTEISEKLTQLMHGYKKNKVDIAKINVELFGNDENIIPASYEISVPEILTKTVDGTHILDNMEYPLLDKTLRHSFTYLFLRLMVERALVEKFSIDTNEKKQLGEIIAAAYPNESDIDQIRKRIKLTSKKTLINEFNHFEGNLSIFQPAIDITDQALGKERTDIVTFVKSL